MAVPGSVRKLSIRDLPLTGKRVLVRVDFNVPLVEGKISDDSRITAALPTLRLALERGAALILASHLGRPQGSPDPKLSLAPVAERLGQLLEQPVAFLGTCSEESTSRRVSQLEPGDVLLLENLRFDPREKANDSSLAGELASYCDVYINDAFGTAHRAHASTVGIPRILGQGAGGLLMEKELDYLSRVTWNPETPVVAVLGGAKVSDKIEIIANLIEPADSILVGGGMAYTFLKALGCSVGNSILEEDKIAVATELLAEAERQGVALQLPVDHVVAREFSAQSATEIVSARNIPEGMMALDIGPETSRRYAEIVLPARTLFWNGPMGVFEFDSCAQGTFSVARAVAESNCLSVVGGGDSVAAINKAGLAERISHISTGGGASLAFVAGKQLPGVAALSDAV